MGDGFCELSIGATGLTMMHGGRFGDGISRHVLNSKPTSTVETVNSDQS